MSNYNRIDDDDNDFDFDDRKGRQQNFGKTENVQNQPYDEAIEVSQDGSEIMSQDSKNQSQQQQDEEEEEEEQSHSKKFKAGKMVGSKDIEIKGEYNPDNYTNLHVSSEIKDLFKYIGRYKPTMLELDAKLKPFIPEYIPAVGEVDAFLKMPRPDGQKEELGLKVMDEPALNQSKKAKLDLMMNEFMKKKKKDKNQVVHSIENADKNPKEISGWINDVSDLHKSKQPPSVSYTKQMPDIDHLMQVWPQEIEDVLMNVQFPSEEIDLSLEQYCQLSCNFLDIPVHPSSNNNKNIIESLHVLFTLYSEFKANQHFQQQDNNFQQDHFIMNN